MARRVVRDFDSEFSPRLGPRGEEKFRYVLHPVTKGLSLCSAEEMPVVFEQRTTACTVDDDRIRSLAERPEIFLGQTHRTLVVSGVGMQCSATNLALGLDHIVPVRLEGSAGRSVHVREQSVHDAAGEETHRAS